MKKLIVLASAVLVLSIASAGNALAQSQKPNSQLKFAFSIMVMDNPYFISVKKGLKTDAKNSVFNASLAMLSTMRPHNMGKSKTIWPLGSMR